MHHFLCHLRGNAITVKENRLPMLRPWGYGGADMSERSALAYVFERFPTFTQTFCFREVRELGRQGMLPTIFSIRTPQDEPPQDYPAEFSRNVLYLPEGDELAELIKRQHSERLIPRAMRKCLQAWESPRDRHRVYEAAWIGPRLKAAGIRHVHVHFAGIAARTAYWLKQFYGISFSFTGHANDIFVEEDLPVKLGDLMREAAFVVTVSEFSATYLRDKFPFAAKRVHRVYNGIETDLWPGSELRSDAPPTIVSVGRYIEKKGFLDLIRACGELKAKIAGLRCRIIGDGPQLAEMEALIAELGLGEVVELTGPKSQTEIQEMIGEATVFALPCKLEKDGGMDNLPTVIMEAMCCGRPVVSTRIAGVPEMLVDGKHGRIHELGDVQALAGSLHEYLTNPALAAEHGRAAMEYARGQFAIEQTTGQLKHLLVRYGRAKLTRKAFAEDRELLRSKLAGWI